MNRILIAGFQHETNTFSFSKANYKSFEMQDSWLSLLNNKEVIDGTNGTTLPIAGFIENSIKDKETKLIPIIWCSAEPSSFVTDYAYKRITENILNAIKTIPSLDGVYLDLHGAMVTESLSDGEGNLLQKICHITGKNIPIVISLDMHANVSKTMFKHSDAITMYRTYPHLDMYDAGKRAFDVLKYLINGGKFYKEFQQLPFLIPLHAQSTLIEPCKQIYENIKSIHHKHLKWAEFATGFPCSDVIHSRPSLMYYSDTKLNIKSELNKLYLKILDLEGKFNSKLFLPNDAVHYAKSLNQPIILADVQDNPGAGSSSDTIEILESIVSLKVKNSLIGMINDTEIAQIAHNVGLEGSFEAIIGGKLNSSSPSFKGRFKVIGLSNGQFKFTGKMYKGIKANSGLTTCLSLENNLNIHIVVSSVRCQALDKSVFTHLGLNLNDYKIIAVKSTVHFIDDFESFSKIYINVKTSGHAFCDLSKVPFKNLEKGIKLSPNGKYF